MTRFWITLVVLYSFTNWRLLQALEDGAGSVSLAPPASAPASGRSFCRPQIIAGFILSGIISWGGHHLYCAAAPRHNPPATPPGAISTATVLTAAKRRFGLIDIYFSCLSLILLVWIACSFYKRARYGDEEDDSSKKVKKRKSAVGPKSNIDDPKMMSATTTNGQVESSASTTTTGVV